MICYYCFWGWPKAVSEVYQAALAALDGYEDPLLFGPSHIVWSDENFDDSCIKFCLDQLTNHKETYDHYSDHELGVVHESLVKLSEIPESIRTYCPEDYDDEHPENFPPTIEMVKFR